MTSVRRVRLGDVCFQDREAIGPGERSDLRYIGLESIGAGTGAFIEGELSKTPAEPRAISFRFTSDHVLYGKLRPYLNKVALPDFEGKCSTEIVPLRPGPQIDRAYAAYFLRSGSTVSKINARTAGAQMPRASMDVVLSLELVLPPLDEQRRRVDILSRAESIVRLRQNAQGKAAELVTALFLDMFGNPATNPMRWPTERFGAVGNLDRGKSRHRPRDAAELHGGPYPFIQTGDVSNSGGRIRRHTATYSEMGLAQSRLWPADTLCITIAANIAKTGILDFEACFPDSVVGFLPGAGVRTYYVQAWLGFLQPLLEASAPQAAQKNINLEILRNLSIPVPPIAMQDIFARRCEDLLSITSQQEAATVKAKEVFDTLLSRVYSTHPNG